MRINKIIIGNKNNFCITNISQENVVFRKSGLLKKGGQGQLNTNKVGKAASNKRTSTTPDQKYVTLHNLKGLKLAYEY